MSMNVLVKNRCKKLVLKCRKSTNYNASCCYTQQAPHCLACPGLPRIVPVDIKFWPMGVLVQRTDVPHFHE